MVDQTQSTTSAWIVAQVYGANVQLWNGESIQEAVLARHLKSGADSHTASSIAVGDEVQVERSDPDSLRVVAIAPRRTHLERAVGDPRGRTQVIAANATQAIIVSSIAEPEFRPGLVDRWGLLARRGGLVPLLCLNKVDLGTPEMAERAIADAALSLESVTVSATSGAGIDQLLEILTGQMSVLVGHSGVGKSSLLRRLVPDADAATATVSAKNQKGRHTTSSSRLYQLPGGGSVIDTPGVRSVVLGKTEVHEVAGNFLQIAESAPCRFRTCTHRTEPGCSILAGLESGVISRNVYARYRKLLEEVEVR